jgi:exodeoxyribonuclease V alpha subunit
MNVGWAKPFVDAGVLAASDVHGVALVAPRFGEKDVTALLGLALAARAPRHGHAGVDLASVAKQIDDANTKFGAPAALAQEEAQPVVEDAADADSGADSDTASATPAADATPALPWPSADDLVAATLGSPMVGGPEDVDRPFVRQEIGDRTLVLTRRLYGEQVRVADAIRARAAAPVPADRQIPSLEDRLATLLPADDDAEARAAVTLAANRVLAMVIGGPGTGKTFSITRLLAALFEGYSGDEPLVVKLAAPTGKAAARMQEAIREACDVGATPRLDVSDAIRTQLLTLTASTLHKLVGLRPDGTTRHHATNPIAADVVVVDEVSMVDLALMRKLLEAVPLTARLVLLGDRDQLASVEAGCVLADLVRSQGLLGGATQTFTKSRRFADAPDVACIAACLQSYPTSFPGIPTGDDAQQAYAVGVFAGRVHATTERHRGARVTHLGRPDAAGRPTREQVAALAAPYLDGVTLLRPNGTTEDVPSYIQVLASAITPRHNFARHAEEEGFQRAVLDAFERYRVLAVHRRGPLGVAALDAAVGELVKQRLSNVIGAGRYWVGRPILVTENAYDVGLMNGDVGVVLPCEGGLAAVFPAETRGKVRRVAISRLPRHEGALVMTVHKSQGSQFDRVALVLSSRASPIQTRELVYTGVTRSKNQLAWLGDEGVLADALRVRVQRASGLEALLSPAVSS